MTDFTISVFGFDELDTRTAYGVWALRQQVFIVEQQSLFADLDGRDLEQSTRHLLAMGDPDGPAVPDDSDDSGDSAVLGYLRLVDDGGNVGDVSDVGDARIGRVVVAAAARRQGLADALMRAALAEVGTRACRLDAQTDLVAWYSKYGFEVTGPEFDDAGIAHLPMRRPGTQDAFRTP